MKRRTFLRTAAVATAAGAAAAAAGVAWLQPRGSRWPPFADGRLDAAPQPRTVAVVGGGLAGIAAAETLARRGYRVTLFERAAHLGGKLAGWPAQVLGETVPMEHGFHGFFDQYYNLRELLAAAGADRALVPQDSYSVLFADGREEAFGDTLAPFPLDLLEVLARSPSLGLADVAGDREGMRALLSYDPDATFARWDHLDAARFITEGRLEGPFTDLILEPFGQASMNALGELSAAELIRFFHFYMLGSPEGLGFAALGEGVGPAVLEPLRARLEGLGVDVRTSTPVRRVRFEGGRAVGLELGSVAPATTVDVAQVPQRGWAAFGGLFVRREGDGFQALDGRCTHMGCPVQRAAGGFLCPCHAGRYDESGRPVGGPPERPLAALTVRQEGDALHIEAVEGQAERFDADAVVLATELRGLQALASASGFAEHAPALDTAARAVGEALPYAVVRFWLDAPVAARRPAFYTVAGYDYTDSLAIYSHFQQPYIDWAERTGGAVVECHAYAIPPERQGGVERYRDALLAELRQAFPELADASVLHVEAMAQSNFTRFGPGEYAARTPVRTSIDNLVVAGDHVHLPFPAFLMEAAVASGRLAANALLARDGVVEHPVHTVALRGKLAGLV